MGYVARRVGRGFTVGSGEGVGGYEGRLQALGRLLDQRRVTNVCITEVANGLMVLGQDATSQTVAGIGDLVSFEVTHDELDRVRLVVVPTPEPEPMPTGAWRRILGR